MQAYSISVNAVLLPGGPRRSWFWMKYFTYFAIWENQFTLPTKVMNTFCNSDKRILQLINLIQCIMLIRWENTSLSLWKFSPKDTIVLQACITQRNLHDTLSKHASSGKGHSKDLTSPDIKRLKWRNPAAWETLTGTLDTHIIKTSAYHLRYKRTFWSWHWSWLFQRVKSVFP